MIVRKCIICYKNQNFFVHNPLYDDQLNGPHICTYCSLAYKIVKAVPHSIVV